MKGGGWKDRGPGGFGEGWRLEGQEKDYGKHVETNF